MREAEKTDFSLKTKDEEVSRVANPTPPDPGSSLPADLLVTLPDRSCMGDPTYELDRPMSSTEARLGSRKHMDHLLQLIRSCPLRDTECSMSMKKHTTEQNMTTFEDGHNTADDGGPLQIRDSSGYEEQHSRSFHEAS